MGDIHTVMVGPGSVVTLRYTVSQDCDIRWKFKSEGGDLGFGVQRKKDVQNVDGARVVEDPVAAAVDVLISTRVASQKDIQAGVLQCQAGFTYLLNFDNRFSRFKAKKVMYGVVLEDSDLELSGDTLSLEELVRSVRDGQRVVENKEQTRINKKAAPKITESHNSGYKYNQ
eukprot:GFUD01014039.1.p1 GENE.GFUD01014039.1~~GFUD01014039.1.p1  ORF type:complete len:171 (+),score=59.57 GFUD01014039.1:37-549(+)